MMQIFLVDYLETKSVKKKFYKRDKNVAPGSLVQQTPIQRALNYVLKA